MLVELCPFPRDVVSSGQLYRSRFQCVVLQIASAVRHVAVGIRVAETPVQFIVVQRMLARELSVVCSAAAVVIFRRASVVVLFVHALSERVAVVAQLVEDVFHLELAVASGSEQRQIEHSAETGVVVILVVERVAQVYGTVVALVVHTELVVLHITERAVFVCVVQGGDHSKLVSAQFPSSADVSRQFQVAERLHALCCPIIVQSVPRQVRSSVADRAE